MAYNEAFSHPSGERLTDKRESIYRTVSMDVLTKAAHQKDRPFILGVNGVDTSGKTQFALGLVDRLAKEGAHVQPVHIDDFSNPHSVRNTTQNPVDNYYDYCFDLDTLIGRVLYPARFGGQVSATIDHIDTETDERSLTRQYDAYPGSILLIEGVFLFRPEILPYLDYRIFLDIPLETMMQRATERDVPLFGSEVLNKYRDKYLPAQQRYIEQVDPASLATISIDNTDWQAPAIIKRGQGGKEDMNMQDFFHECEVKYQLSTMAERHARERQVQEIGFGFEERELETDFLPDTEDFQCRKNNLLLRFRRTITQSNSDILLTLKVKGDATKFQEFFELEYKFSNANKDIFEHINQILNTATGKMLPTSIHEHDAEHFTQLITQVKTIFPAHRILLEKKRSKYSREDCHILFDTLPEGIGDYLEIEAPSSEKLTALIDELNLDATHIEPLDYGDILKRHKQGRPDQEGRVGVFSDEERGL